MAVQSGGEVHNGDKLCLTGSVLPKQNTSEYDQKMSLTQITDHTKLVPCYHLKMTIDQAEGTSLSNKEDKDQESIQSSTAPDPGYLCSPVARFIMVINYVSQDLYFLKQNTSEYDQKMSLSQITDHTKLVPCYHLKMTIDLAEGTSLSNKEDKDQESIQSSTAPDPGYQWESDNFTIRHHKREPRGQPFPRR